MKEEQVLALLFATAGLLLLVVSAVRMLFKPTRRDDLAEQATLLINQNLSLQMKLKKLEDAQATLRFDLNIHKLEVDKVQDHCARLRSGQTNLLSILKRSSLTAETSQVTRT